MVAPSLQVKKFHTKIQLKKKKKKKKKNTFSLKTVYKRDLIKQKKNEREREREFKQKIQFPNLYNFKKIFINNIFYLQWLFSI